MSWLSGARAATAEATTVFIECKTAAGTSRGSGVVVSVEGHVLTARHVLGLKPNDPMPGAIECAGSIGVADRNATRAMIAQPITVGVDAALLQFQDQRDYEFMRVCKFEDWMIRRKIFVAGFPGMTETGVPSFREGVLSTTRRNSKGVLETDGQTIAGMSGGPAFSSNLKGLVGIVIGAQFTPQGTVDYFGILPIEQRYIDDFQLTVSDQPCFRRGKVVDLPFAAEHWEAGDSPVPLGVTPEEGSCFITSVWGAMNEPDDVVEVAVHDGQYVLRGGQSNTDGSYGAKVSCTWFD
ncbi:MULTISPECIES: S1 family peptidase [Sinorhizobium]|nr:MULTISPECIES: serine protease [Sinorhizobium]AGG75751.1 putative transmembrane protein [Sinorhizobium meliloti 2011]MCK3802139.1 trypsin-like peptidase domain-containing protein [Sinorhizobium meliloti]MCK3806028.1 trypsin-like peptidase domain-containing protein [Sinorhizobium meliloti]MCK3814111.1 trypsin-like peptidase domain-containing protein [Sinorhizobium meliloti]MDE4622195.1 serine protease [Sinorhizobium meliloti]